MMDAEDRVDVHHGATRRLLGLFDAAAGGLADWSEFDAEAERHSIEVGGLSREELTALIESSTREIPTTEHRTLHQEASDERGPYWYFQYREGGKRKKLYLGKTSNPEITLVAKRAKPQEG